MSLESTGPIDVLIVNVAGHVENQLLLAGITGSRIRVLGSCLQADAATNVRVHGGVGSDWNVPGRMTADKDWLLPVDGNGWGETAAGEGLYINADRACWGLVRYQLIK